MCGAVRGLVSLCWVRLVLHRVHLVLRWVRLVLHWVHLILRWVRLVLHWVQLAFCWVRLVQRYIKVYIGVRGEGRDRVAGTSCCV